jgi:hypothetical protein
MHTDVIIRLIKDKFRERHTYAVALVVGTLINLYGQLLVPWLRGASDPFAAFASELQMRPGLTLFSVFLAFAFPLCVGVYSSVTTRYKNRRIESIADFPERKPDPVFRAKRSGEVVEAGATTITFLQKYKIGRAQNLLGDELWNRIVGGCDPKEQLKVYFDEEGVHYLVGHSQTPQGEFNIYLTRLTG